jgi:hypothetical protein
MDRPSEPLTPTEHRRVIEIVGREAPDLLPLARDAVNTRWLTDDECEALASVVLRVFLAHIGPDDEPDQQGVEADDLLGRIQMQRTSYWRT